MRSTWARGSCASRTCAISGFEMRRVRRRRHGVDDGDVDRGPVAQALAAVLGASSGEPGDVDEVDGGVDLPGRLEHSGPACPAAGPVRRRCQGWTIAGERVGRRGGLCMGRRAWAPGWSGRRSADRRCRAPRVPSQFAGEQGLEEAGHARSWSLTLPGTSVDVADAVPGSIPHGRRVGGLGQLAALARRPADGGEPPVASRGRRRERRRTARRPCGRPPGAFGLVTSLTPSSSAAAERVVSSQVAPPMRLTTQSSSPPPARRGHHADGRSRSTRQRVQVVLRAELAVLVGAEGDEELTAYGVDTFLIRAATSSSSPMPVALSA